MWSGAFGSLLTLKPKPQTPANTGLTGRAGVWDLTPQLVCAAEAQRAQCRVRVVRWMHVNKDKWDTDSCYLSVFHPYSDLSLLFQLCPLVLFTFLQSRALLDSLQQVISLTVFHSTQGGCFWHPGCIWRSCDSSATGIPETDSLPAHLIPVMLCVLKLSLSSVHCLPKQNIDPHVNRRSHTNVSVSRRTLVTLSHISLLHISQNLVLCLPFDSSHSAVWRHIRGSCTCTLMVTCRNRLKKKLKSSVLI